MTNLNVQQEKAVTFDGKHLLVLAGAGTGKTRTIIERALYLIRNGIPAHRIMILSFTRKSASEIVERIRSQADRAVAEGLAGQTFHSWCMSIIKNSPDIFKQSGYTVLDEDDRESCFKLLCGKRFKDSDGRTLPAETILSVYSYAMNTQCSLSVAMRIISNFRDEIAWMRYLQLWKGIGNVTATRVLGDIIQAEDLDECLGKLAEKHLQAEITRTLQLIKDLQYNPAKCIDVTVSAMQKRMQEKYHEEWTWRKEDFPVLVEVATATDSIGEFVAEYVLDPKLEESIRKDGDLTDKCILSTIHSAKGLEARNCFVTGVSSNGFPSSRALNNGQEAVEEERRCLYVALTRAKDRLYVYRNISSIHGYERAGTDMSAYFFNGLPVELTVSSVIGGNRYFCDERYTGPQLSVENDFLFD